MESFARAATAAAPYPVPLDDVLNGIAAMDAFVRSAAAGSGAVAVAGAGT